ncbi:bifunctional tRNA (5-methylaminomethyl-2-thiouridine)(34)-methyltransferase MnmD/FAD-dependent 5-carboxymethylaminomethyl-2-thiouridine(34) oxidoreductase MnmC [Psychromonas aquatilis]|uniref:tRNA 5-methylaminomethyl-2-thiouridine biosynthesis bifunctional protein MnmC n=1 Tax=Psychromonas aquatilis TaxID=2005072 RepID=A0ABU9GMP0_9GAMM
MYQPKNNIITHAKLDWSDQSEPFSTQFDDIYFNNNQGVKESQYVFCEGNTLENRWLTYPTNTFCIAETGFGTGLNFINTVSQFCLFQQKNPHANLQHLHFISFEQYPLAKNDLIIALQKFPQFKQTIDQLIAQYPISLTGCHRLILNEGHIVLDLWFGDVNEQIEQLNASQPEIVDAWYLDGFNPHKNPDMWHLPLFKKMYQLTKSDATLATFTAAGFVRRALIEAGFIMSKRKGYGKKREMLVGKVNKPSTQTSTIKEIAIVGGGIAALTAALSLAKRNYKVTVYCKDKTLGVGASGNLQGALYPLVNEQHSPLSQLFTNAYLFALNFYQQLNTKYPFAHNFNGLLQLAYDQSATTKLQKIMKASLPDQLLQWVTPETTDQLAGIPINTPALYYPTAGWLSPRQLIQSLLQQLQTFKQVTIQYNQQIESVNYQQTSKQWQLTTCDETPTTHNHHTVVIAAGFDSIKFEQCKAVPLSAARGQVSHIPTNQNLQQLNITLCHEGYLTPGIDGQHCMGATFKRHDENTQYRESEQADNTNKLKKCVKQSWVDSINTTDQAHIGIRCTTRDHFPYVGALTDYQTLKSDYQMGTKTVTDLPNIYLFTGLGSRGLCSAPLLAEVIASKINNESLPISKEINEKIKIPRQWIAYINKNKPLKV